MSSFFGIVRFFHRTRNALKRYTLAYVPRELFEICFDTKRKHLSLYVPSKQYSARARLTHWGRLTHICVSKLTIIGSDNGLSPGRRQAIIWTNAGILLIWPLGTNFNEILIEILTFSFMKMRLKVSSAKWRPFCLGLNVLIYNSGWRLGPLRRQFTQRISTTLNFSCERVIGITNTITCVKG